MRSENDLDQHIHQIEERLASRRERLGHDVDQIGGATRAFAVSPGVLSAAAGLGFFLARATSRKAAAPARAKRRGVIGLATTVGMALIRMRYGDPAAWIGRFLAGRPSDRPHA